MSARLPVPWSELRLGWALFCCCGLVCRDIAISISFNFLDDFFFCASVADRLFLLSSFAFYFFFFGLTSGFFFDSFFSFCFETSTSYPPSQKDMHLCLMNNNDILFFNYGTEGSTNKNEQERRLFCSEVTKSSTIAVKVSGMGLVI